MTEPTGPERRARRTAADVYEAARECEGSFDEWPLLPDGVDPMPYLTRYRVPLPFWLAAEHDQLIIIMAGRGSISFAGDPPLVHRFEVGDFLYVPAGVAAKLSPDEEVIHVRYRAEPAGWEAARWYCASCHVEVFSHEFDAGARMIGGYLEACELFNAEPANRACSRCGAVASAADMTDITWADRVSLKGTTSPLERRPSDSSV